MFWKKKKSKAPTVDAFSLEVEEGPRNYFRVSPAPDRPVTLHAEGKVYQVVDISAGGLALKAPGLGVGRELGGVLFLPGQTQGLPLFFNVRSLSQQGVAGGEISKIKETDRELIHLYVLEREKQEIELRRKRRSEES